MAKGVFTNLSFRADAQNTESGVNDKFSQRGRPKLKFNFTISFKFREPIQVGELNKDGDATMFDEMTFALKQASRPNPTINYTDVNYYNYRTKVGTKVDYGSMNIQFYDDVQNFGHDVFETYLKSISPVANIRKEQVNSAFDVNNIQGPQNINFNTENIVDGSSERIAAGTGSIGPLPLSPGGELGLLENVTLRHWFYSETERRDEGGRSAIRDLIAQNTADQGGSATLDPENIQFVEYQFLNPKIVNMTLDELDMGQSDASMIMMNFVYDSVFIDSPLASNSPAGQDKETDGNTFTLNDIRSRITDVQRLVRRIRRLDTLPDISVLETAGVFTPPITGNLPNIQLPRPDVDLPPILDTF